MMPLCLHFRITFFMDGSLCRWIIPDLSPNGPILALDHWPLLVDVPEKGEKGYGMGP